MLYEQLKTKNKNFCSGRVEIIVKKLKKDFKFSNLASTFVSQQGAKNSFDMGSGGPKYHPQFFVCKSEDFFSVNI